MLKIISQKIIEISYLVYVHKTYFEPYLIDTQSQK